MVLRYDQIKTYVKQTHHRNYHFYDIEVQDIFEVVRHEEEKRFEPFKTLHNRQLLWHGSSLTNFVGILSNGLKLAPPDVEINGKAFGNGIYFADTVAKSSHYCNSTRNGDALLLLCEVALGDIQELQEFDQNLMTAPNGKHSVKGLGIRFPRKQITRTDGVLVPYGKADVDRKSRENKLEFNEYIVYNEAQVKIRYLIRAKFTCDGKPYVDDEHDFDDDDDDEHCTDCDCSECATDDHISDSDGSSEVEISNDDETIVLSD